MRTAHRIPAAGPLMNPRPFWSNIYAGPFGPPRKEVRVSLYRDRTPASLKFVERVGFLRDDAAAIRRALDGAMKRLGVSSRARLRETVDHPKEPLMCRTLREYQGEERAAVVKNVCAAEQVERSEVFVGAADDTSAVVHRIVKAGKTSSLRLKRYTAFIKTGLTDLERATDREIVRTGLLLGLCTGCLYDPSPDRSVIWTDAALRRRVELYTAGNYYREDR
jgi:hypothetical protein